MSSRNPPTLASSPAMRRVLDVLRVADRTQAELSERAYVSVTTLQKGGYMKALLAMGVIHVCRWNPPPVSGNWTPVYRYGAGENVPPPQAAGNTEYTRRWRHKRGNSLKVVQRQMANLTPSRFSMAGLLGVRP